MAQQDPQNGASEATLPAVSFAALKPHLFVEAPKANVAVAFYKNVFGAEEVSRTLNPKRKADQEIPHVLSAELKIAGSLFLVADTVDDSATPVKSGGNGVVFALETDDVEGAIAKAVKGGAVVDIEGASGEGRVGKVTDPYGYVWQISAPLKKDAEVVA
ncbi:unnamed protein product [Vicia faba]|uniref:VOC domain-containing protein n=1 Tax=Vicia faba TaxID=3906 RepID=A0AAV1ARN9_VICFA|nr:unnamed protein product [Vicia faba]